MAINIVIQFEEDCFPGTTVINRKQKFQGRCGKVKGRIMFVIELSLRIMAINIVLQFEEDCFPGTKVIDRKQTLKIF